MSKDTDPQNTDIFNEEFDKEDVVNPSKPDKPPFEELKQNKEGKFSETEKQKNVRDKILSDEEIAQMAEYDAEAKRAVDFLSHFTDEEDESGVVKKKT